MIASSELRTKRSNKWVIAAAVLALAAASGFEIGRTTAPSRPATVERRPIVTIGPMSASDRTRFKVYRKMNRILAIQERQ